MMTYVDIDVLVDMHIYCILCQLAFSTCLLTLYAHLFLPLDVRLAQRYCVGLLDSTSVLHWMVGLFIPGIFRECRFYATNHITTLLSTTTISGL